MPDREKTIELLKEIADFFEKCRQNVSFGSKEEENFWEFRSVARDAIELLKEQEAVKPMNGWLCGQCGCRIYQDANYCYNCGRKVKRDE